MMDHVKLFDWCYSEPDRYFVEENDLDNCCTESILKNKFYDPLVSSESDDDNAPVKIDWNNLFKNKKIVIKGRPYVPALKPVAPYPKLSTITGFQHFQLLKVLCYKNPRILPDEKIAKPSKIDYTQFEDLKEKYQAEQKEYIEWAKSLWQSDHCIRALRPKPTIETVYEAEFKIRAQRLSGYPQNYMTAAQIPLESKPSDYEMVLMEELISVNTTDLPEADIPDSITKQLNIIRPCSVPEPCHKHSCQFILPNSKSVSTQPLRSIHRSLAQFCVSHKSVQIASEGALRCLVQTDRPWSLPLSVCDIVAPDGEVQNVVVLDSEFCIQKEAAPLRTYKALRHLLEYALVPSSERERMLNRESPSRAKSPETELIQPEELEFSSDEEDQLFIDAPDNMDSDIPPTPETYGEIKKDTSDKEETTPEKVTEPVLMTDVNNSDLNSCSCKDSFWEKPPPRSFKRFQIRSKKANQTQDFIVHCAHKVRSGSKEVVLEPIPEYQLELGASKQSDDVLHSLTLSMLLRPQATIVNARIDATTGDVVTLDRTSGAQFLSRHPDIKAAVTNTLYSALNQLQGLMPGHYVLTHEPNHGKNCILLVSRDKGRDLQLQFSCALSDTDQLKHVHTPTLTHTLLPYHKLRRILPCAFTPQPYHLCKHNKRQPNKLKTPPQAIKWPKRKKNKKKKN